MKQLRNWIIEKFENQFLTNCLFWIAGLWGTFFAKCFQRYVEANRWKMLFDKNEFLAHLWFLIEMVGVWKVRWRMSVGSFSNVGILKFIKNIFPASSIVLYNPVVVCPWWVSSVYSRNLTIKKKFHRRIVSRLKFDVFWSAKEECWRSLRLFIVERFSIRMEKVNW